MDCSRHVPDLLQMSHFPTFAEVQRKQFEPLTSNNCTNHKNTSNIYIFLPSPWFSSEKLGSNMIKHKLVVQLLSQIPHLSAKMQHNFGRVIALQGRKQRLRKIHGIWERWWTHQESMLMWGNPANKIHLKVSGSFRLSIWGMIWVFQRDVRANTKPLQ